MCLTFIFFINDLSFLYRNKQNFHPIYVKTMQFLILGYKNIYPILSTLAIITNKVKI